MVPVGWLDLYLQNAVTSETVSHAAKIWEGFPRENRGKSASHCLVSSQIVLIRQSVTGRHFL